MSSATVTVAMLGNPRGKYGSFKDTAGGWWGFVLADCKFEEGGTYNVEYDTTTRGNKTYKNISQAVRSNAPTNGHAERSGVPPHVSNWVAHAIQAGLIKQPEEMTYWAQWAFHATTVMTRAPTTRGDEGPDFDEPTPAAPPPPKGGHYDERNPPPATGYR